jgi:hypothetical protein
MYKGDSVFLLAYNIGPTALLIVLQMRAELNFVIFTGRLIEIIGKGIVRNHFVPFPAQGFPIPNNKKNPAVPLIGEL